MNTQPEKPLASPDGTVSCEHHYLLFCSADGSESMVFAYPRRIPIRKAIGNLRRIVPDGWQYVEVDDPTYERGEVTPEARREFLTAMAKH